MSASDFDAAFEQYNLALGEFPKGDPEPLKEFYSQRDDVTLANPFGPPARGWRQVAETMERAATYYRDGYATGFDQVVKYATADLAYIVEVERYEAKVGGSQEMTPVALRVTTIFRPEGGVWKVVHRHADPITSAQPAESVIQR